MTGVEAAAMARRATAVKRILEEVVVGNLKKIRRCFGKFSRFMYHASQSNLTRFVTNGGK